MRSMEEKSRWIVLVPTLRAKASVGTDFMDFVRRCAEENGYVPELIEVELSNQNLVETCSRYIDRVLAKTIFRTIKEKMHRPDDKDCQENYKEEAVRITNYHRLLAWITRNTKVNQPFFAELTKKIKKNDRILIIGVTSGNFAQWVIFANHLISEKKCQISVLFDDAFKLEGNMLDPVAKLIFEKISLQGLCLSYAASEVCKKSFIKEFAMPIRDSSKLMGAGGRYAMNENAQVALSKNREACSPVKPLVFYSLKNLSSPNSGSSLRLYLLVRYLKENLCDVSVCMPQQHSELVCDNIFSYDLPETAVDKIVFAIHSIQQKLSISRFRDIIQLIAYCRNRDNRALRRALSLGLENADSLFVEHILYLDIVKALADMAGVPVCVTLYDDDSNRCYLPFIKKIIKRIIIGRLKKVDAVATVEKKEHDMLESHGVKNYLIPSTADTVTFYERCAEQGKLESDEEYTILFVGSNYYPNIEAKKIIFDVAKAASDKNYPWKFVIAGGCASPEESQGNVKALGVLSREDLVEAYHRANLLISPLVSGVGAAVKAIEGLGTGKPFLGTSITFRGLDVHDGQECYIEDKIDNFISRISTIYAERDKAESVGGRGKALARQYDFRNVFTPYLTFAKNSSSVCEHQSRPECLRGN